MGWADEYGNASNWGGGQNGGSGNNQSGGGLGIVKTTILNKIITSCNYYIITSLVLCGLMYYTNTYFTLLVFGDYITVSGFTFSSVFSFAKFTIDFSVLINCLLLSFIVSIPVPILVWKFMSKAYNIGKKHISGSQLLNTKEARTKVKKETKKQKKSYNPRIFLGFKKADTVIQKLKYYFKNEDHVGLPILKNDEVRNFGIFAKIGAGKSQLIFNLFNQIFTNIKPSQTIIFEAKAGDFVSRYMLGGSNNVHFFYPGMQHTSNIGVDALILTDDDIFTFASYLIPSKETNTDTYWDDAARDVLISILYFLKKENRLNNKELFDYMLNFNVKKAIEELSVAKEIGVVSERHLQKQDVLGNLDVRLSRIVKRELYFVESDFNVIEDLKNNVKFKLFISKSEESWETLEAWYQMLFARILKTVKTLEESKDRRILLGVDEANELGKDILVQLEQTMSLARDKGLMVFFSNQNIPKIQKLIGKETTASLMSHLHTKIIMQSDDETTCNIFRDFIGKEKFVEKKEQTNLYTGGQGAQLQENEKEEYLFQQAYFSSLDELQFICKYGKYIIKDKVEYSSTPLKIYFEKIEDDELPQFVIKKQEVDEIKESNQELFKEFKKR